MRLAYVRTSALMSSRELGRQRLVLALALMVPAVFFGVVLATTASREVPVMLAAAGRSVVTVDARRQALLFISIAAAGLISAFIAANLVQRQQDVSRRLVLCGYRAAELLLARLLVLLVVIVAAALYTWLMLALVARPVAAPGVAAGIALAALVYGCYGLLVGVTFRRDLEAVFAILVLVNIDAGWLQNPIYYEGARARWLIEVLPAHFPSQIAYVTAFTAERVGRPVLGSVLYAGVFLLASAAVYAARMRIAR